MDFVEQNVYRSPTNEEMDILYEEIIHDYLHKLLFCRNSDIHERHIEKLFLEFWDDCKWV